MNNLPKHHGAGPPEAPGPIQLHRLHRLKASPVQSSQGGARISEKEGAETTASISFAISILEFAICLVGKAHVTKMKLNFNFFPLGLQIQQISYCIFKKPVICTNLITCSAKPSFLQLSAVNKFCNTWFTVMFTVYFHLIFQ